MVRGFAGICAVLGLSLSATAAQAQEHWTATPEGYSNHLSKTGAWQFSALKKGADGNPECLEVWQFGKDGTGMLISGQQKIELSWKFVRGDVVGMVLRIDYLKSSSGKDCMGREVDPSIYPRKNGAGFELLFRNADNSALVCNAPQVVVDENGDIRRGEDGKPMTLQSLENCWGEVEPLSSPAAPE